MKSVALILAGGRGERFWPKSTSKFPKQFLSLFDKKPMILLIKERLTGLVKRADQYYVIPADLAKTARRYLKDGKFIVEPAGRNTAAAIGLAALVLQQKIGDAVMFVLPADHLIKDKKGFQCSLEFASDLARDNFLVTFGIKPTRPETGYGYIKCNRTMKRAGNLIAFAVDKFKEKPDRSTAYRYLRAKNYYWNSGIFVWRISTIVEAIRRHAPVLYRGLRSYLKSKKTEVFKKLPAISIDYQVMEKAGKIALVRADFDWDDVGSWDALSRHYTHDVNGNIVVGRFIGLDAKDSIIFSERRLVAAIGIENLVIVDGDKEILICKKDQIGKIRKLVKEVKISHNKEEK